MGVPPDAITMIARLPQGSGLGLVLSQHDLLAGSGLLASHERPGRLQPLHHLMKSLYKHEDPRRH
jgi:hypothetical protein